MPVTAEGAARLAVFCGFARAALLPAEPVAALLRSPEAKPNNAFQDPYSLLPEAKSVLVAAMPFHWYGPWRQENAEVSSFYLHSQRAHEAIVRLADALSAQGARVSRSQDLPQKPLGRDAGFGVIGKNTLLRNTAWGSCLTLRTLLTDIEPGARPEPMDAAPCGDCRRCADACPTGALDGQGNLDTGRCLRAHMMGRDPVPEALREAMGVRLLGCEICQRACPHNAEVPTVAPEGESLFAIGTLLKASRADLDAIGGAIGWNEARLTRVQAQAALASGNTGHRAYVGALAGLTEHERPAVAEHARWAVDRLKGV